MPPLTSSRRVNSKSKTIVHEPSEKVGDGPTTFKAKGKQKEKVESSEERRISAMIDVNASLQTLSSVAQSGWKANSEEGRTKSNALGKVSAAVARANEALTCLRVICPDNLDVERAASSMISKLLALEMHDDAFVFLNNMQARLLALLAALNGKAAVHSYSAPKSPVRLLSLPLPMTVPPTDTVLLNLISTYLMHAIITLMNNVIRSPSSTSPDSFSAALLDPGTLLTWVPYFVSLPEKHKDTMLTRTYTVLTKSCSSVSASSRSTFLIRMYALKCLLCTSTGTVQPTTFWDQVQKLCATYVKTSSPMSEEEELSVAKLVSECLGELVQMAQSKTSFMEGKSFVLLCETWTSFAKRSNDLRILDRITDVMSSGSSASSATEVDDLADNINQLKISVPLPKDKDTAVLECARACVILTKVTACLDVNSHETDDLSKRVHDTTKLLPGFEDLLCLVSEENDELKRAQGKLQRSIERLRRACVKILDGERKDGSQVVISLLMVICTTLEGAFKQNPSKDTLTASLDSLFILTRTRLKCNDPNTYTPTLDLLNRAIILVDSVPDHINAIPVSARADYIRCISGAYHNLAGSLYQNSKYGGAVRFLKEACVLGARALHVRAGVVQDDGQCGEQEEVWKQLEEQLFRRWELLAVCYSKIGDRKLACDAFLESVKAFPYASSGLERLASSASRTNAFNVNESTKQLGTIIDRLTYAVACELFLPSSEVSLLTALKPGTISDEVVGLLLERQVMALEPCLWKDGVQAIVRGILRDTLSVYQSAILPFQRLRVLLKCMEFLWKDRNANCGETCWTTDHLGDEIVHLLAVEDLGRDSRFASFHVQYTVAVHLWLSLFAYRSAESSMTSTVSYHVEEACKVLRGLIPRSPDVASPNAKPSSAQAKKLPKEAAPAKKPMRATSLRVNKRRTQNPVTPHRRKVLENVSNVIQNTPPRVASTNDVVIVFDLESVAGQLQMNVHLLGLLGLVLLKVKLLETLKRLCERQLPVSADLYLMVCIDLASEYVKLGKTKRANSIFACSLAALKSSNVSDEIHISYLLKYGELLALGNNILASASSYCEAMGLWEASPPEDKATPTAERIKLRAGRLERAALACRVSAAIQYSKNNMVGALECMLQSLRLWNRAVDTLSRLSPPSAKPTRATEDANPFESTPQESSSANDIRSTDRPTSLAQKRLMDGMEWRMIEGLLSTLLTLTQAYFTRGSSREAEYFAQQALDLAESVNAPTMAARALMRKGEIQLCQRQLDAGRDSLSKAAELLQDLPGVDAADMRKLKGDWNRLNEQDEDARGHYEEASAKLVEVETVLASIEGSRRKSIVAVSPQAALVSTGQGAIVLTLLSDILRRHIWLLRDDGDTTIKNLIEQLKALPASQDTKGEERALMGKLTLHSVYEQFRSDMFLSSLAESTIALPMGMTSDRVVSLASSTQDILSNLDHAEELFWADLALTADRGNVPHVREAAVHLALIRALQTSLGNDWKHGPIVAARLLDVSSAITLRREMLETIQYKFPSEQVDDLQWPPVTPSGSLLPRKRPSNARRTMLSSAEKASEDEDEDDLNASMKAYWHSIVKEHAEQTFDASSLSTSAMSQFPSHWTVVHISLTPDKSTLFISRQNVSSEPLMFCVPLKGRRESNEDEHLTFDDAMNELAEIIRLSDQGTRNAVNIRNDDPQARVAWWAERNALDRRMRGLLDNIEFCWLGAFKTIFSPVSSTSPELIADLRTRLEKVFKRILPSPDKKQKQIPRLSDVLLNCFSSLSPKCREEELEDLIFFVLDLYTFHGIPVAIADVDLDQATIDLRCALEEHNAFKTKRGKVSSAEVDDSHIFLVLDRNVMGIPWESIPVLRGQSVSRIPSVAFLRDRVRLASAENRAGDVVDRISMDSRKTFFVLNPSGDLKGTEGRFKPWLEQMRSVGWEGVIGRPPSEQQFLNALAQKDLVIYFGHGGAEQYARSHKIRHLQRCAATMLWGCSSGSLKDMGDFDRVGTPFNYMLAGCPLLVANLWDVTDRDIDKFSQTVFDSLRLTPARGEGQDVSVVAAVAQARGACKLKYLTGAAPVVYGIPFYL